MSGPPGVYLLDFCCPGIQFSMLCCTLLYIHSSFAIILMGKRELVALLGLSSWCLLIVVWLFLAVQWVCLQLWFWYFLIILTYYLCTDESLSLLYLLFISWFICSWRWCMNKLGVFHANQTSICLDPDRNSGWVGAVKLVKALQLNILLTIPERYFFCGLFVLFMFCDSHAFVSVHCCLVFTC